MDPVVEHDVCAKSCASGRHRDPGRHGRLGHETWKIVRNSLDDEGGLAEWFQAPGAGLLQSHWLIGFHEMETRETRLQFSNLDCAWGKGHGVIADQQGDTDIGSSIYYTYYNAVLRMKPH
jgi:hypothetical protein